MKKVGEIIRDLEKGLINKDREPEFMDFVPLLRISNMFEKFKGHDNILKAIRYNELENGYAAQHDLNSKEAYYNLNYTRHYMQDLEPIEQKPFKNDGFRGLYVDGYRK